MFRKVGGFVYVMSVLVSMEGCLGEPPTSPWDTIDRKKVLHLLKTVFNTITIAMRYEPANAKFFANEVSVNCMYRVAHKKRKEQFIAQMTDLCPTFPVGQVAAGFSFLK